FSTYRYRTIGPYRAGRSDAVVGVEGNPRLYYFGATGGGVWKTENSGHTWSNISDGYFGGSIGAIAVSKSDKNTLYVGGGEKTIRGNVSHGSGMWKSEDGGSTWVSIGLEDSRHISRIRIHPENPSVVYVAAMGHLFGPNEERGVFRTLDGGKTWKRVLFVNDEAGAVDLILDPNNPRIIYASLWKVKRTPYSLESGGEGSGLWKSTDGGDTWKEITDNPGLPQGPIGIIGVTVSPVNSQRLWASIEAKEGGIFRSDNGGESWERINEDRNLRQRAWYYSRIYAGPKNIDEVYVLNVGFWRSKDGGKTFSSQRTPHGDHHDLWIDPQDPQRMAIADDGGAQISFDRGINWSSAYNQPTAQFYRVTTDDHFPYRIYGAQQDNSTVRILSRSNGRSITDADWESTAGGESGHIAIDPRNNEVVFGGSYGGLLTRLDHRTGERRNITVWPDNPMGHGAIDYKYRFQWNFPIFFSPHDPTVLYTSANVLFKSTNEGQSWEQISPDLTRNDPLRLQSSGGPITKDNTGVEYYCTIFAAIESPHEQGVLWTGSDDGLIHISRNGGKNWENVTPPDLPEWSQINSIEAHPTEKGGLYVAATRYKSDDLKPYLYKTLDYGKTWTKITKGIDRKHFTRVVRADPGRKGLLYAGTENGIYISFNDGVSWKPFQLNLPIVPITDLVIKNDDLVVATQGRSFWVLDDLTLLHQLDSRILETESHFFKPRSTYRIAGGSGTRGGTETAGQNAQAGVVLQFYLSEPSAKKDIRLEIRNDKKELIKTVTKDRLRVQQGMNRYVWDMRHSGADSFPGMVLWGGGTQGPLTVPGSYTATLYAGENEHQVPCEILADPRSNATKEDYQAQFDFLISIRDKLTETHQAIISIREVRSQINSVLARLPEDESNAYKDLKEKAAKILAEVKEIEESLYQTKNRSAQDPLNFPIRLNNKLANLVGVVSTGNWRPTDQAVAVKNMLTKEIDLQLSQLKVILGKEIADFNTAVSNAKIPAIVIKKKKE
ncbi:MAG: hypothetical protein MPJ24_03330, partial [Pirellulaceae bacterium]|nr:hypothetical protein [Pirellulaceae bacterium]